LRPARKARGSDALRKASPMPTLQSLQFFLIINWLWEIEISNGEFFCPDVKNSDRRGTPAQALALAEASS
jgi:hypothetical protein